LTYTATSQWKAPTARSGIIQIGRDFIADLAILVVSLLVAVYLRHVIPAGGSEGSTYPWPNEMAYGLVGLSLAVTYVAASLAGHFHSGVRRILAPLAGAVVSFVVLVGAVPGMSIAQKVYFLVVSLILVALLVPFPVRHGRIDDRAPVGESIARVWRNRELLRIWVSYNVRARYAQAVLGIAWIVLFPLSTAFIMSLVFADLLHSATRGAPFIAFFLAGIVPWGLFNQSVAAGMRSIVTAMGLINQIYFPREIIVLSSLGEAIVDTSFMLLAMLVIDAIVGVYPNGLFVVLPLLFAIELSLTLGLMLLLSWLSAVVRDIPQLVTVLLQMLFYLTPIIYPLSIVPPRVQALLMLNPLTPVIVSFRGIVVYNTVPDWASLIYPAALGVALLVFGYRSFKSNEDYLADLV